MISHLLGDRIGLGKCLESRFILPLCHAAFQVGADETISLELLELCCEIVCCVRSGVKKEPSVLEASTRSRFSVLRQAGEE